MQIAMGRKDQMSWMFWWRMRRSGRCGSSVHRLPRDCGRGFCRQQVVWWWSCCLSVGIGSLSQLGLRVVGCGLVLQVAAFAIKVQICVDCGCDAVDVWRHVSTVVVALFMLLLVLAPGQIQFGGTSRGNPKLPSYRSI